MRLLKWLTHTRALERTSGEFEFKFFESVYRVFYLAGLSLWDKSFAYLLYSYSVKSLIILFVLSEIWYLCCDAGSLDKSIECINVTLIHFIAMYRYSNMLNHKETFAKLSGAMESKTFDVSTQQREMLVQTWIAKSERYFKLLISLGSGTLIACVYAVNRLRTKAHHHTTRMRNESIAYSVSDIRVILYTLINNNFLYFFCEFAYGRTIWEYNLTVALKLPLDYATPLRYPVVYIITMVAFHYTSFFVIVNDLLMQVILMQIICQYAVLADCFENIHDDLIIHGGYDKEYDDKWRDLYINRLRCLVDQHKFIISNTMELKNILNAPMLGQLAASGMLICFAGYQVTAVLFTPLLYHTLPRSFYIRLRALRLEPSTLIQYGLGLLRTIVIGAMVNVRDRQLNVSSDVRIDVRKRNALITRENRRLSSAVLIRAEPHTARGSSHSENELPPLRSGGVGRRRKNSSTAR
ncbi:hypothetical protein EVAR_92434_1 [Eumeta japonica]|uniref:Odorant receptor n=1 Tax=Eumeta variegata TaxID=151549 RepID=A0A4C1T5U3_EUMVA|nr:hypothetical protein EVAR_92434_1 [Eumeta japonica]